MVIRNSFIHHTKESALIMNEFLITTNIYTRVWAWVTEYMQVSMLVNTMLYFNKRYLHIFNHPRLYPSITVEYYCRYYCQEVRKRALCLASCQDSSKSPFGPDGLGNLISIVLLTNLMKICSTYCSLMPRPPLCLS